jgi:thiamine-monophosphate kinase
MVLRSGAKPGDRIFVSGTIGDGALGLRLRQARMTAGKGTRHLLDRYLHPQPRVALAEAVRENASAAMDVSDGLVGDLAHICETSGVGATVRAASVPLSPAARAALVADPAVLPAILNGGDDYEILCTVPKRRTEAFVNAAASAGVPVSEIGEISAARGYPEVVDTSGAEIRLSGGSHTHF